MFNFQTSDVQEAIEILVDKTKAHEFKFTIACELIEHHSIYVVVDGDYLAIIPWFSDVIEDAHRFGAVYEIAKRDYGYQVMDVTEIAA